MRTISRDEVASFESIADRWWDVNGPLKPLHKLNPVRLDYLRRKICEHYARTAEGPGSLAGLSVLDVGCGGGLVCEPMARLGATVTGIDAGERAIACARAHAIESGLDITYACETADRHKGAYDVVLALEIIEHVPDADAFVRSLAPLVKPGGLLIFSTLNRTAKSFALGIVAAEYILRWLPAGTHRWSSFVKPSEIARMVRPQGFSMRDITGLVYDPLTDRFTLSPDRVAVNYFLTAAKA